MTSRVNVGRYIDGDSFIYRLDPRIKIVMNIIFLASIFIVQSLIALAIINVMLIAIYLMSKNHWSYPLRLIKFTLYVTCLIFLCMAFFWPEFDDVYFRDTNTNFKIARHTIEVTLRAALRLYGTIMATTIVTITTKPMDITRAIESLLMPLKKIKFPVHIISMVISLALQFLPLMIDHGKKIAEAQAARGMDTIRGSWWTKIKGLKSVWIPLVASAFTNSIALGAAMDARGYDPYAKRSRYVTYQINWFSITYLLFGMVLLATIIYFKFGVELPRWWW